MGESQISHDETTPESVRIQVWADGPYEIRGPVTIVADDGTVIRAGEKFDLCRCGNSKAKPFCDNSHKTHEFRDSGLGPKARK